MSKILQKSFFERDTVVVAQDLIGKFLVKRIDGRIVSTKVIETEAYDGFEDKAAHGSRGKTARNEVMFGEAGKFYVYFVYGMHWMLNVVCGKRDFPAAVLIRGVELEGSRINGPARLTRYLKVDKAFNDKQASIKTGLWFEDRGIRFKKRQIMKSKRIGVGYAGDWANKLYRFYVKS